MVTIDELSGEIFDGKKPAFYTEFEGWVRGSRRLSGIVTLHSGEIAFWANSLAGHQAALEIVTALQRL